MVTTLIEGVYFSLSQFIISSSILLILFMIFFLTSNRILIFSKFRKAVSFTGFIGITLIHLITSLLLGVLIGMVNPPKITFSLGIYLIPVALVTIPILIIVIGSWFLYRERFIKNNDTEDEYY